MAQNLEELVGPWERILFRSACGRGRVAILSGILAILVFLGLAFPLALAYSNSVNSPAGISSLIFTLVVGFVGIQQIGVIFKVRCREVLLTEHRLLYRHGTWRSKTTEIDLAEVTGIVVRGSQGSFGQMAWIERGRKGAIIIWPLPHLDQLRNVIAGMIHIPIPQRNEKAVRRGINCVGIGSVLGGSALAVLPSLGLFLIGGGGDFWEFGAAFWDLLFLYPADSTFSAILVSVTGFVGFVGYLWLIATCFFAGSMLGYYPTLAILRYFLTPAQAHKTICGSYPSLPSNGIGKVMRWHTRQTARFASWLYGQQIRCD